MKHAHNFQAHSYWHIASKSMFHHFEKKSLEWRHLAQFHVQCGMKVAENYEGVFLYSDLVGVFQLIIQYHKVLAKVFTRNSEKDHNANSFKWEMVILSNAVFCGKTIAINPKKRWRKKRSCGRYCRWKLCAMFAGNQALSCRYCLDLNVYLIAAGDTLKPCRWLNF